MFSLLRMSFWSSLVLLALPLGGAATGAGAVGPVDAFLAAREAVSDLSGLCERKPGVCETGQAAVQTIGVRAREGSRIAFELLDQQFGEARPGDDAITTGAIEAVPDEDTILLPDVAPLPQRPTR